MRHPRFLGLLSVAVLAGACTVGQGEGSVTGHLDVPNCPVDQRGALANYDMQPDFFGALPAQNQLLIRIQRGGGIQNYADSLTISVDDMSQVVARYDQPIPVELERPPGSAPNVKPPLVRVSLSLRGSCGSQRFSPGDETQVVLHGVSGWVRFHHIIEGDPYSRDTDSKRIEGDFDVQLADPRGYGAPQDTGSIQGHFKFFFQRGGPAQPFP